MMIHTQTAYSKERLMEASTTIRYSQCRIEQKDNGAASNGSE